MSRKADSLRRKFVIEYLIDQNATQAAIRAGYSPKTARSQAQRLLTKVDIQSAISTAMEERSKRTLITADYVLTSTKEIIDRCMQAGPVFDREGKETGEYQFQAAAALKGLEMLGKHLCLFTDKIQIEHLDSDIERELARLAAAEEAGVSTTPAADTDPGLVN